MDTAFAKISKEDLPNYLGKEVNTHQLEDVLDVYMILTNAEVVRDPIHNSYVKGILDKFSEERLRLSKRNSTLVYNPSYERDPLVNLEYW